MLNMAFWKDVGNRVVAAAISAFSASLFIVFAHDGVDISDWQAIVAPIGIAVATALKGAVAGNIGSPDNAKLEMGDSS